MTRDTVEQGPMLFLPPSRWAVMPYSQKDARQAVYFWHGAAWRVGQLIVPEELIADQEDGVRPLEYTVKPLVVESAAAATASLRARAMQRGIFGTRTLAAEELVEKVKVAAAEIAFVTRDDDAVHAHRARRSQECGA